VQGTQDSTRGCIFSQVVVDEAAVEYTDTRCNQIMHMLAASAHQMQRAVSACGPQASETGTWATLTFAGISSSPCTSSNMSKPVDSMASDTAATCKRAYR
jgi:hypothetical protein